MAEAALRTSKGRARRGSGSGRARVAAWEAMGPRQLPLTLPSLLVALR
jgi:hypothetical protein